MISILLQLLDLALAKKPDDRIGNASELLRQLEVLNSQGLKSKFKNYD
jgi:hypothetical protein